MSEAGEVVHFPGLRVAANPVANVQPQRNAVVVTRYDGNWTVGIEVVNHSEIDEMEGLARDILALVERRRAIKEGE